MTIQNPQEYVNNIWDWAILRGCFGDTRIEPTDIDGLVERNGYLLLMETKAPGVEIKQGQRITHSALVETGAFAVFNIWGRVNQPQHIQAHTRWKLEEPSPCDLASFRARVAAWFAWANAQPKFTKAVDVSMLNNRIYTLESERDALAEKINIANGLIQKACEVLAD